MAFKLIAFAALIAVARAGLIPAHGYAAAPAVYSHAAPAVYSHAAPAVYAHAAPVAVAHAAPIHAKVLVAEAPAKYSFQYGVHDSHTGDVKEQHEERNGDAVQGYYTLNEADGTKRIVHYTADDHNGFNAVVQREGKPVHPVAVKAVAPVAVAHAPVYAHAAPLAVAHAAPAVYAHAAPLSVAHAAPLAYASHGYHH
ncbi:cuticle protein 8-like [Chrysoperla carnea]|uniref:cuticle protein 8-like n=1 Tax=Chrysoperla carnea TaxID=189513 RepID=UPI001D09804C|nr:cuticle protein 8-like [Chrysoperla carnea]